MAGICSNEGGDQSCDSHIVQVTIRPIFIQPQCVSLTVGSICPLITLLDSWVCVNLKIRWWYEEAAHCDKNKSNKWELAGWYGNKLNTAKVAVSTLHETSKETLFGNTSTFCLFLEIQCIKSTLSSRCIRWWFYICFYDLILKSSPKDRFWLFYTQEEKLLAKFPTTFSTI